VHHQIVDLAAAQPDRLPTFAGLVEDFVTTKPKPLNGLIVGGDLDGVCPDLRQNAGSYRRMA